VDFKSTSIFFIQNYNLILFIIILTPTILTICIYIDLTCLASFVLYSSLYYILFCPSCVYSDWSSRGYHSLYFNFSFKRFCFFLLYSCVCFFIHSFAIFLLIFVFFFAYSLKLLENIWHQSMYIPQPGEFICLLMSDCEVMSDNMFLWCYSSFVVRQNLQNSEN
jgi:hypothetical protein